jgi:hypothetical protein
MTSAEMFAVWYSEYPRHEARKDALKAWTQINPDEELFGELLAAVKTQKKTLWLDRQRQFIPLPATWLRGERWTDEVVQQLPSQRPLIPVC